MEGSGHKTWLTDCIDESVGSSERVQDQNTDGTEYDQTKDDTNKRTSQFRSPTYTYDADDSGFGDLCLPPEVDDEVLPVRRETSFQGQSLKPAVCSTPNRGTLPDHRLPGLDITQSSPVQVQKFEVPPLLLKSYFISHCDTSKWNFDQSKGTSSTIPKNIFSNQYPRINYHHHQSYYAKLLTLQKAGIEQNHGSEFTRGHSTIASLLNSRPLNVVKTVHNSGKTVSDDIAEDREIEGTLGNSFLADQSSICKFEENKLVKEINNNKISNEYSLYFKRIQFESDNLTSYPINVDSKCFDEKNEFSLSKISDENESQKGIDKNNNNLLVQKYSDISDACVSDDTETSVETSSSEDEQPTVRKDIIQLSGKNKRKSTYPRRSLVKDDPTFKGVTVKFQTSFSNGHSRLHMSAFYSNVKVRSSRRRSFTYGNICSTPQYPSDADDIPPPCCHRDSHVTVKTCTSCKTRRTPLWRDAEDGTPLCNACGIRYKKYRLRCSKCWHIPKKEVKTYPNCPVCGASLRFSFHKKSW